MVLGAMILVLLQRQTLQIMEKAKRTLIEVSYRLLCLQQEATHQRAMLSPQIDFISRQMVLVAPAQAE
jgi:hypothetical protein